ncbi:mechanosensitive ion channel family protein [Methanobacterium sp.]|jgi:small conductance mechanosensitive channel|uniref:mechanosensitive ion channel family protein n=1 Tax=Methanobacterium sp. TaxID=2164 RepID=UPI003158CF38
MAIATMFANIHFDDIIAMGVTLIVAFLIVRLTSRFLKNTQVKWDLDVTMVQVLNEIIKYTIYLIAAAVILGLFGINLTAIAVSLGVVSIVVGFAARDTLSNFIAGMFIFLDKSFRVGDIVEVSNQKGKVVKMGFRLTTIITYDKKIITIPNALFSTNPFINHTASDTRRVDLDIVIPYTMNLEETSKSLEDMAAGCDWVLKKPKPKVIVRELIDVGVRLTLCVWVNDPWRVTEHRSALGKAAKKLLRDENTKNG